MLTYVENSFTCKLVMRLVLVPEHSRHHQLRIPPFLEFESLPHRQLSRSKRLPPAIFARQSDADSTRIALHMQITSRTLLIAAVFLSNACGPASPSPTCGDAAGLGRGVSSASELLISCSPLGSDLQCSAVATNRDELYICKSVNETVTDQTTWMSSNPSVAVFGPAGSLKVLAAGVVAITPTWQSISPTPIAFNVAPGVSPERMVNFTVIVQDSVSGARVPSVRIDVMPQRGQAQTCQTGQFGSCLPNLWILPGSVELLATKAGYVPLDKTIAITIDPNNLSYYSQPILSLMPSSQ